MDELYFKMVGGLKFKIILKNDNHLNPLTLLKNMANGSIVYFLKIFVYLVNNIF